MSEIIFMVSEPPEGGYAAEALGHRIFTVADTLAEVNEMVRDAVICHSEEASRPKMIRLHFVARRAHHGMKLPRDLSGGDLAKALGSLGYRVTHQTGSHLPAHNAGPQ